MKKIIALALAFAMLFSFSALAFAASGHEITEPSEGETQWKCSCGAKFDNSTAANKHKAE